MKKSSKPENMFFRVCLGQINTTVGDFAGNRDQMIRAIAFAKEKQASLIVFPELTITGYPPEDLLFKKSFIDENQRVLREILACTDGIAAVVGFAERDPKTHSLYNAAAVLVNKKCIGVYQKNKLPNYGVFDEKRYFCQGDRPLVVEIGGVRIGISICEDIWDRTSFVYRKEYSGQTHVLVNISASPYHRGKQTERKKLLKELCSATKSCVIYQNLVGGQDELVFDGGSLVMDAKGKVLAEASRFKEDWLIADIPVHSLPKITKKSIKTVKANLLAPSILRKDHPPAGSLKAMGEEAEVYSALVLGVGDYVRKNGFKKVLVGISGGIDSALVAAIAVDALGADHVIGVTMPSPYTSPETYRDSKLLATRLGMRCLEFRIDSLFAEYKKVLESIFSGQAENIAEENLQARIRGNLLMALSNKFGHLVLTTGNKSEIATGYCTLYGDMAGGFAVIKDVPKTLVYQLTLWRNASKSDEVIPRSIIDRAPTAELRLNQTDQDSLPPYELLDRLIDAYVEKDEPLEKISRSGIPSEEVLRIARKIDLNEYKRRQAPPGIKITPRAFGRDRRMPITNRFTEKG